MKVSINSSFITGPYGGGMQIAFGLKDFLTKNEVKVVNNLQDDDVDIIIHLNPFPFLMKASSFSFFDAFRYKLLHPKVVIINQINECDERKGTHYMNRLLIKASRYSDFNVFIADWLKPLLENQGLNKYQPYEIILNGADATLFNTFGKQNWDGRERLKIVTHHWGGNFFKGHDIYKKIDNLLEGDDFANRFSFTFIGNVPSGVGYKHATIMKPLAGIELAEELKKHHVYITASRNEPAGLHHIEGILSGLPVLYINSGALPQYCFGYGLEFNEQNLVDKLDEMYKNYNEWVEKIRRYDRTFDKMNREYLNLFIRLYNDNEKYEDKRILTKRVFSAAFIKLYGMIFSFSFRLRSRLKLLR